ncbi:TPA: hypothetical protein HA251_00810 [Candidatus Woesearchaeota archaeon]|nr:hypothetical protein [Candidatus Woesearchaeota archaeon]
MAKSTKAPVKSNECCARPCAKIPCSDNGLVYGLGFIGAAIYYVQTATGFWNGVLGILKALVWPAMLVYKLIGL